MTASLDSFMIAKPSPMDSNKNLSRLAGSRAGINPSTARIRPAWSGPLTRRGFLRQVAAAGSFLALHDLARAAVWPGHLRGLTSNAPLILVSQSLSTDVNPRARTWPYITEILRRAGLFFDHLSPAQLERLHHRGPAVVVLAGHLPLSAEQRRVLTTWVSRGGAIIGLGGTSGLDEVFGVKSTTPLAEGWLKVTASEHPITAGLRSSLHVFGGCAVTPGSASSLAKVEVGSSPATASAILEHGFGQGRAVLLGPDLIFSIVHIQQGISVLQDGKPAPDGSAIINEGMLKAEDGLVLDWQRDRTQLGPDNGSIFLEPIADELREIILRTIFHLAQQQAIALPMLWYWPRSMKAVGLISHDTDGNEPNKAVTMLELMNRCAVKSTWCVLYPGGYPTEFFRRLKDQEFEIGLHYDAMHGGEHTSWSKDNFLFQKQWLLQTAELQHITTNKNHYTRWEGRLDFLRWCEAAGINSDQTRGPSKKGTIGFPLGGSQPYFPFDDEAASPRFLNVLEVNLLTQDLIITCPREYGPRLFESALRHHGVGHFLFHPAHIEKPGVADALSSLLELGRSRGIEWWTSKQIYDWEMLRRGVEAKFDAHTLLLHAGKPLHQATLLLLRNSPDPRPISLNGTVTPTTRRSIYGFDFDAVTLDIAGRVSVRLG
jgi:hypothetical protein